MRKRGMPDRLPLQALQKLLSVHPALLPEDLHQFNASSWYFSRSRRTCGSLQLLPVRRTGHHLALVEQRNSLVEKLLFGPRIPATRKVLTLVVTSFLHTHNPTPHTNPKGNKTATLQLKPDKARYGLAASACQHVAALRASTCQHARASALACQQRIGPSGLAF